MSLNFSVIMIDIIRVISVTVVYYTQRVGVRSGTVANDLQELKPINLPMQQNVLIKMSYFPNSVCQFPALPFPFPVFQTQVRIGPSFSRHFPSLRFGHFRSCIFSAPSPTNSWSWISRHTSPHDIMAQCPWSYSIGWCLWYLRTKFSRNERWPDKNLFDTCEWRRPEWVIAFSLRLLGLPPGAVAPPCECDDDNDESESQAKINIIAQPGRRHQRRMLGRRMPPLLRSAGPFRRRHPPRLLFDVNLVRPPTAPPSAIRQTSIADWLPAFWSINPRKAECGRLSQWELVAQK